MVDYHLLYSINILLGRGKEGHRRHQDVRAGHDQARQHVRHEEPQGGAGHREAGAGPGQERRRAAGRASRADAGRHAAGGAQDVGGEGPRIVRIVPQLSR